MNYEKIIMELFSRIQSLEEKVDTLMHTAEDAPALSQDSPTPLAEAPVAIPPESSGRMFCRQACMDILRSQYGQEVRKANRSEGSGLLLTKNGVPQLVRVAYSRYYPRGAGLLCSGWHTVGADELNNEGFSYFIFALAEEQNPKHLHYFIFTLAELKTLIGKKLPDANQRYHFDFMVYTDGRAIEARGEEKNMLRHYNNWKVFQE